MITGSELMVESLACICSDFFFSSRRRHTRLQGDWSSRVLFRSRARAGGGGGAAGRGDRHRLRRRRHHRSEERRVGKECRSRWAPDHLKKKENESEGIDIMISIINVE